MKIVIVGAGSLGLAFGAALSEAGNEVWMLGRNAKAAAHLSQHGLFVETPQGKSTIRIQASADAKQIAQSLGAPDLLIILVKSFHTEAAILSALPLVAAHTTVLSLQNGLGHEEILAKAVGREKLIAGKTYVGGNLLSATHLIGGWAGKQTLIGELDGGYSERVQNIAAVFSQAGLATTASDNILGVMWDKLCINVATGALSVITRLPYGELYKLPMIEAVAVQAVEEAMAVAQALGVKMSLPNARQAWTTAGKGLPYEFKTSMLQSIEKGSVTEIDYVNGAVQREGARVGVATPVNATLVACVKGIESTLQPSV